METGIIITAIIAFLFGGITFFFLWNKTKKTDDTGLRLILQQINELSRTVDQKIGESSRHMNESVRSQLGESANLIREVTKGLIKLDETNKQVVSFADQLQNLQDILKNPKHRGIIGEYYLETILKNVLPPGGYRMQYEFQNGEIVDAVVFVKDKIIPVDSKFSLENYNRLSETSDPAERDRLEKLLVADLKTRISETAKYIRPGEGTMEFAFMFIPHEAIYYDLLINKIGAISEDTENLIQRAAGKYKVIIVNLRATTRQPSSIPLYPKLNKPFGHSHLLRLRPGGLQM
jgi:DNA recombination protein RmuC